MANADQNRIFVTGATGQLGSLVIQELLNRIPARNIVAGVRSTDHEIAKQFVARGVEVRIADYTKPDTLVNAFSGIDKLLLISSNATGDRVSQHENVINAAKAANVGLIIYTSLLHADTSPLGVREEHLKTEVILKSSNIPFTLLRHGWYLENHLASIAPALQYGVVMGSAGEGRFSTASRADFAAAAAVVLTSNEQEGRIYELAGDENYTLTDFANVIATASGKSVAYVDMPKEEFKSALIRMGLPEELAELISDSDVGASNGGLEDNNHQLSALIGRPTTSWLQMVEKAVLAIES